MHRCPGIGVCVACDCVCSCVCVEVGEGERERERGVRQYPSLGSSIILDYIIEYRPTG